jgi:hypothetical protein
MEEVLSELRRAVMDEEIASKQEPVVDWEKWEAQVARYTAKVDDSIASGSNDCLEITGSLPRMQDEVRKKLQELEAAGDEYR